MITIFAMILALVLVILSNFFFGIRLKKRLKLAIEESWTRRLFEACDRLRVFDIKPDVYPAIYPRDNNDEFGIESDRQARAGIHDPLLLRVVFDGMRRERKINIKLTETPV